MKSTFFFYEQTQLFICFWKMLSGHAIIKISYFTWVNFNVFWFVICAEQYIMHVYSVYYLCYEYILLPSILAYLRNRLPRLYVEDILIDLMIMVYCLSVVPVEHGWLEIFYLDMGFNYPIINCYKKVKGELKVVLSKSANKCY